MNKKLIQSIFAELENANPDKSIEWLLAMTIDNAKIIYNEEIDASEICEALFKE